MIQKYMPISISTFKAQYNIHIEYVLHWIQHYIHVVSFDWYRSK